LDPKERRPGSGAIVSRVVQHASVFGLRRAQRAEPPAELEAAYGIGAGVLLGLAAWAVILAVGLLATAWF
jgi:hypothetical protein